MPSQSFTTSVLAGATNPNIVAGSQFEFPGVLTQMQIFMIQDPAVGLANAEVFFGSELQYVSSPVGNSAAAGLSPKVNEDGIVDDVAMPGARIVIGLSETGGAATAIVHTLVKWTPLQ